MKLGQQIERKMDHFCATLMKPWRQVRRSQKWSKTAKLRAERHRANIDPECNAHYRRYSGFDY